MPPPGYTPYLPQSVPIAVADNLWIVDGPEIGYRFAGLTLPCPTRMTMVRIGTALWLHSPTHYSPELGAQLETLGEIAWIVAPNSFHYSHVAAWAAAYPAAACHVSPDVLTKLPPLRGRPIPLGDAAPSLWRDDLDQLHVDLGRFVETIFFHRPSGTLIVSDLIQNFEAGRIRNPLIRAVMHAGGATGPGGKASIDIRFAARRHRERVREALAQMLDWAPGRIILSHGKGYDAAIADQLRCAFRWAAR
ncbi:MAG: hypothetical protein B7Y45_11950 [Sphingomonas sp. 28-66-16]|nr:MAG: hypothetical protein B7Y45_11950 [Sphingomonas sp. 28-66-16]